MASGVQVVLILALAFGVPLLFVLRELKVTKRDPGDWQGRNSPPDPPPPPPSSPTGQETSRPPLPACLVSAVRGVPMGERATPQRVLELV
jgi:hypothetical protein